MNAHTPNKQREWHSLTAHLNMVAELAKKFSSGFDSGELARFVGLYHDVGKGNAAFQEYLLRCNEQPEKKHRGPDHKGAGAILVASAMEPLAFLVAGHHGGLPNRDDLSVWLKESLNAWPENSLKRLAAEIGIDILKTAQFIPPPHVKNGRQAELFLRLLFSCLVDADFLDTEAHFNSDISAMRGHSFRLDNLWRILETEQRKLAACGKGPLHEARNTIYRECLAAAESEPGFFRLTVPTGGGKTRSGMAFCA